MPVVTFIYYPLNKKKQLFLTKEVFKGGYTKNNFSWKKKL